MDWLVRLYEKKCQCDVLMNEYENAFRDTQYLQELFPTTLMEPKP